MRKHINDWFFNFLKRNLYGIRKSYSSSKVGNERNVNGVTSKVFKLTRTTCFALLNIGTQISLLICPSDVSKHVSKDS
jgi:hypothetical protein